MMVRTKRKPLSTECLTIDAAYGLVQGVYGYGNMDSDEGYRKWHDEGIQAAAMKAAKQFLGELRALEKGEGK